MSMTNHTPHNSHDSAQVSAEEMQRLGRILERSQPLIGFLQAYSKQPLSNAESKVLQQLVNALENQRDPFLWISDPKLAAILPLIIRFNRIAELSQTEIRETIAGFLDASLPKTFGLRVLGYPLFMATITFIFLMLLGYTVIPVFGEMYREFGLRLPGATKILVGFSGFLNSYPALAILSTATLLALLACSFSIIGYLFHRLQIISVIGFWVSGSKRNVESMTHWLSVLAELLELGFAPSRAIPIAATACRSPFLKTVSYALANELQHVASGRKSEINASVVSGLPATVVHALCSAPSPSPSLLRQIAYANRVRYESRQQRLGGLLGPVTTIFIGLFVGFVILALFLPLISLVTSLS